MNEARKKTRRRYGAELNQQILAQCAEPGASVASIAMSHGINANVVHKWRRQACGALPALQAPCIRSRVTATCGVRACAGHLH
ncbi:transposase [Hydrogenophaga sp. Root209]|uniref:transposase n=1 Tax=Hydrogenophaga sp. Root209 TaxID=1736490 RepID=UPI000A522883|nr:transposase [Hydrogenophaga sp. Root209]